VLHAVPRSGRWSPLRRETVSKGLRGWHCRRSLAMLQSVWRGKLPAQYACILCRTPRCVSRLSGGLLGISASIFQERSDFAASRSQAHRSVEPSRHRAAACHLFIGSVVACVAAHPPPLPAPVPAPAPFLVLSSFNCWCWSDLTIKVCQLGLPSPLPRLNPAQ